MLVLLAFAMVLLLLRWVVGLMIVRRGLWVDLFCCVCVVLDLLVCFWVEGCWLGFGVGILEFWYLLLVCLCRFGGGFMWEVRFSGLILVFMVGFCFGFGCFRRCCCLLFDFEFEFRLFRFGMMVLWLLLGGCL